MSANSSWKREHKSILFTPNVKEQVYAALKRKPMPVGTKAISNFTKLSSYQVECSLKALLKEGRIKESKTLAQSQYAYSKLYIVNEPVGVK